MWNKIQKIYIGTNQVRPWEQSASYDFKSLTWSELSSQWWINATGSGGTFAMNSTKWIYSSTDGSAYAWCPVDLSKASKLTIKTVRYGYNGSWVWYNGFWLNGATITAGSQPLYITYSCNNNSGYMPQSIAMSWTTKASTQKSISTWQHTLTVDIDFGTWATSYTLDNLVSLSCTASATEITNIKNSSYIFVKPIYNWNRQHECWSMEYTIKF